MKNKISDRIGRSFPLIDYDLRSGRQTSAGMIPAGVTPGQLRGFRSLSGKFFRRENDVDYVLESALFGVIVAISAWPIATMIAALRYLVK